jgi:predicted GNAT family acetyltransferase
MPSAEVVHNSDKQRFELNTSAGLALLEYKRRENAILFTHTEVPSASEGRGVATSLADAALSYARDNHFEIVPLCEFVIAYIRHHPEYVPLVSPKHRSKVERHSA